MAKHDYPHPRRLPVPRKQELSAGEQAIWEKIDQTRGGVWGPYTALMHKPELARRVAAVGELLRFDSKLPGRERELAILTAAREGESRFEWAVHEPIAVREGLSQETLEIVRGKMETGRLQDRERLVIELVRSLINLKTIEEPLYREADAAFSTEELLELVAIAGFYQLLAFVIAGFDVPPPEGAARTF